MREQTRVESPEFLKGKWEAWGIAWEKKLEEKRSASWNWMQFEKTRVNHLLLPDLKEQSGEHCSFCDAFPVSPPSNETIEHFWPKRDFPREAWKWENLYFCCDYCQNSKREQWDDKLLSPDQSDYEFADYFWADATTGTIEIRPNLSSEMFAQAEITLRLYGLNKGGHPAQRLAEQERRSELGHWDIDRFAYRDFLEAGES